ncbi:hypothetical protein SAMN05444422_104240 [Halobiforma haloterrestris]|uniref:Halobacterial output domain-containing protein n=1 Tax=Natronobacterium haloterrestre TaxID=148448 RepID=A0A1I1GDB6_NATHA|nr:HalOD1 output domain-containing protein [Halobiforma haloterrestris]SFC09571.1 hypothetical protein SAMN05444422_104240 [Halobiforma haloterrestris]
MTDSSHRLSLRVVETVADAEDVAPAELQPPINDAVDASALNRLFDGTASGDSSPADCVTFRYCGYDVTVHADGRVDLS